MIEIDFDCQRKYLGVDIKVFIENSINLIFEALEFKDNFYLSVLITSNNKIKEINFNFRKINKPTNVLSFRQNEIRMINNLESYLILGDLVLSLEKISNEAVDLKKDFLEHLLHIVTHGILHLLGYDHQNERDAEKMENKEESILKIIRSKIGLENNDKKNL